MTRLDHTGMSVPDLGAAVEFFVTHFGARVEFTLPRVDGGAERLGAPADAAFALAMLDIGGARVELIQWWSPSPSRAVLRAPTCRAAPTWVSRSTTCPLCWPSSKPFPGSSSWAGRSPSTRDRPRD
ncbi:VOC family protein [Actinomadura yumaensis]|uniref:VOC family protein n=1 Tax=Actinomadura yumaensis TaxID=111807 RepID=UPI00361FDEA7